MSKIRVIGGKYSVLETSSRKDLVDDACRNCPPRGTLENMENDLTPTTENSGTEILDTVTKASPEGVAKTVTEAVPETVVVSFGELFKDAMDFVLSFTSAGWRLNQLFIIIGLVALSFGVKLVLQPSLSAWLDRQTASGKRHSTTATYVGGHILLVIFMAVLWLTYLVMQQITWPSRSYIIGLAATIATAWLMVALASTVVKNRFLRKIVSWFLWIYLTLYYLGAITVVSNFLDSLAVEFGGSRLSVLDLIFAVVAIGFLFTLARLGAHGTARAVKSNQDISPSMQVLIVKVLQAFMYAAAFFIGLKTVGVDLTGLAVLSGAIGVGLGFGLQKVVSNLVSGIIILLDKSIKPGDVISLGETFGWINSLGARYVSVVTRDGKEYLIPNEDLITSQVVNWSHSNEFVRLDINFGTAYHNDPYKVRELAIAAAMGVDRVLKSKSAVCHIIGFGDSSVDYVLRFWIKDPTGGLTNIRGNVYLALWDAFQANDISIPFPQREVKMLD